MFQRFCYLNNERHYKYLWCLDTFTVVKSLLNVYNRLNFIG